MTIVVAALLIGILVGWWQKRTLVAAALGAAAGASGHIALLSLAELAERTWTVQAWEGALLDLASAAPILATGIAAALSAGLTSHVAHPTERTLASRRP